MKRLLVIAFGSIVLYSCGNQNETPATVSNKPSDESAAKTESGNPSYDPERGSGKFTKVDLDAKLDQTMAAAGEKVASVKCAACHKLTDEKLVGPGWKGVTSRHKPEWIMNFVTNTDEMINKDPKVQALLEICMVRMPNQSLTDEDARRLLEFMRKNDGLK